MKYLVLCSLVLLFLGPLHILPYRGFTCVQGFSIDATKAPQDGVFADHEGNIVLPPLAGTPSYDVTADIKKGNVTFINLRVVWTYRYIYPHLVSASLALNYTNVDVWDTTNPFFVELPFVPSQSTVWTGVSRQGSMIMKLTSGSLTATLHKIEPYLGYVVPLGVTSGSGDTIYVSGLYATQ